MSVAQNQAIEITNASNSSFTMAFRILPKQKRLDMNIYYAFCRVVDDIADDPDMPIAEKQARLDEWKTWIQSPTPQDPALPTALLQVAATYNIPHRLFLELIDGVESDLTPARISTYQDLLSYCYKVASTVGLVIVRIFGYKNPDTEKYALELGYALQVTNIIRDVGKDYANEKRIYLPQEEMARFNVTEETIASGKESPDFIRLMTHMAEKAHAHYKNCQTLLPACDRRSVAPAEIMKNVYFRLLLEMEKDSFHVLQNFYRISKAKKVAILCQTLLRSFLPF